MKKLTYKQCEEVNGGSLVGAFLVGVALGGLAKKLANKYIFK
jgi:hypothetical protein